MKDKIQEREFTSIQTTCVCGGLGSYCLRTRSRGGSGLGTEPCVCRKSLAPREGRARWWTNASDHWPFGSCEWKPSVADPVRDLVKAGALIAAEIDRLQRLACPLNAQERSDEI